MKFSLKEALISILRTKLASLITVIITFFAIILTIISLLTVLYVLKFEQFLKNQIEVSVFFNDEIAENNISEKIELFKSQDGIKSVQYINKEEAKKIFIEETGLDFAKILENNPLPASLKIKYDNSHINKEFINKFKTSFITDPTINDIIIENETILDLVQYMDSLYWIIYLFSLFFILLAIYLLYSTNSLMISFKKDQYETMKLVGTNIFLIKFPIYLASSFLSVIAAVTSFSFLYLVYVVLKTILKIPTIPVYQQISVLIICIVIGQFYSFIASAFATRKITLKINRF